VSEIASMLVDKQLAQLTAITAQIEAARANTATAQRGLELKEKEFKEKTGKLSPTEIKMKSESEDLIASGKQALNDLKEAYRLNPNSLDGSWAGKGQQWLYEAAGSKDPTIVNTRLINNLLGAQGLAKLRATFGGSPTEGERTILLELEGIGAKTKEERGAIIKRAYKALQDRVAREQRRLDDIKSGAYHRIDAIEGEK
jgi:predicted transcriptional regulator